MKNTAKTPTTKKKIYTEKQKESAVNRYKNGESVISIAKEFQTSRSTILK